MRREYVSIAAMGTILAVTQILAIVLSLPFQANQFQAFQNPGDVTNTVIYIIMILAFTAVILGLVKYRRQNLARYVIMASIFVTLAFILLLPLYYGLWYATGGNADVNLLSNLSTLLAFILAGGLVYLLVKFPEWYVVDAIGILAVSAFTFPPSNRTPTGALVPDIRFVFGLPSNLFIAACAIIGCLVGFSLLMRFVMKGNPQAGLPLLNGGTIAGYLLSFALVYGTRHWFGLV